MWSAFSVELLKFGRAVSAATGGLVTSFLAPAGPKSWQELATMTSEEFQVRVRDQIFVLDKYQILFDSPNYFSSYFLGEFKEATEGQRQLTLRRDPFLFRIIENYLSGYCVLPLPPNLPPHLSPETALANLLHDAQFYGLDGLVTLLEPSPPVVETEYRIYVGFPFALIFPFSHSRRC